MITSPQMTREGGREGGRREGGREKEGGWIFTCINSLSVFLFSLFGGEVMRLSGIYNIEYVNIPTVIHLMSIQ